MSEIIVGKDGLYKDGQKLKLEFGNLEQIAALRKHEKKVQTHQDGFEPARTYEVTANSVFSCLCGKNIFVQTEADSEGDIWCFEGIEKKCNSCERRYEYIIERKYSFHSSGKRIIKSEQLLVKLKNK